MGLLEKYINNIPFSLKNQIVQEYNSLSSYNYCQWNPLNRIDKNGLLDFYWHPDKHRNIVFDPADNASTLQNYIWRNTGSTITDFEARNLMHTMYNGYPMTDAMLIGNRIYLSEVRKVDEHIATMLSPGTKLVHKGQNDFINSEPVQLTMTVLSFALPAGSILKTFKLLPYATSGMATKEALKFFLRDMPALMIALDNVMGGNRNFSTLPGAFLEDIGYPNLAATFEAVVNVRSVVKSVKNGFDPVSVGMDIKNTFKNSQNAIKSKTSEDNGNTGYENK